MMPSLFNTHVSITHGEDFDGLASQVLVRRFWHEQKYSNCEYYRIQYGSGEFFLANLAKRGLKHTHFVISDINLMERFISGLKALVGKDTSNILDYYDHHGFSRQIQSQLSQSLNVNCFFGPDEKCSTLMIQEHLFPGDPQARFLAEEANHSDLKDRGQSADNKLLGRLVAMKTTANFEDPVVDKIADAIAKPNFYADTWLRSLMEENERICNADLKKMRDSAGFQTIHGVTIVYGYAQFASPGEVANELLKLKKGDVAIGLNPNGRGSVKSGNPKYRADRIAEIWKGGGHEDRAGFDWNHTTNNYQEFLENDLFPKLTELFGMTSSEQKIRKQR